MNILILGLFFIFAVIIIDAQIINPGNNPNQNVSITINCQPNQALWGFRCEQSPEFSYYFWRENSTIKYQFTIYLEEKTVAKGINGSVAFSATPVQGILTHFAAQVQAEANANHQLPSLSQPTILGSGGGFITP